MHRALKTLLLWLIIATLPLQGLAAVTKSACGSAHHSPLPAAMLTDQQAHAQYGHHAAMDGASGHHHADIALADDEASPAKSGDHASHASSYCAACAACCFGAVAPPSVMLLTPAPMASRSAILTPIPLLTGQVPATPKRPPRFVA